MGRHSKKSEHEGRHRMWSLQRLGAVLLLILVVSGVVLVMRNLAFRGSSVDESAVVTVVSVAGGFRGKYTGRFPHRVRFESGAEATMIFGEVFSPGDHVWVSYRRFSEDDRLQVKVYVRQGSSR